jgi:hypothetical protein
VLLSVAFLAGCGGSGREPGTTDLKTLYAEQINVPQHAELAAGVDPDDTAASSTQFDTAVRFLGGGKFELTVTNSSDLGFVNSFTWVHPPQMTITAVKGSTTGTCRIVRGDIACEGMAISPPKCTCLGGGRATVRFEGKIRTGAGQSYGGVQHGWLRVGDITPVPYTIPSFIGDAPLDLPLCGKGVESTEDHPCVHSGG